MNDRQILLAVAKVAKKYNRPNLLKWCAKKTRQSLHREWKWTA